MGHLRVGLARKTTRLGGNGALSCSRCGTKTKGDAVCCGDWDGCLTPYGWSTIEVSCRAPCGLLAMRSTRCDADGAPRQAVCWRDATLDDSAPPTCLSRFIQLDGDALIVWERHAVLCGVADTIYGALRRRADAGQRRLLFFGRCQLGLPDDAVLFDGAADNRHLYDGSVSSASGDLIYRGTMSNREPHGPGVLYLGDGMQASDARWERDADGDTRDGFYARHRTDVIYPNGDVVTVEGLFGRKPTVVAFRFSPRIQGPDGDLAGVLVAGCRWNTICLSVDPPPMAPSNSARRSDGMRLDSCIFRSAP